MGLAVLLTLLCMPVVGTAGATTASASEADLQTGLTLLRQKRFAQKAEGVDALANSGDARARSLLEALLEGRLFERKSDGLLVFVDTRGAELRIEDALTGELLEPVKKRQLRKIGINNALRSRIRAALATFDLSDPDATVRLVAVNQMLDTLDLESTARLKGYLESESDPGVREAMISAIHLANLNAEDPALRLAAVEGLSGNLQPSVRNGLVALQSSTDAPELRAAIDKVLNGIDLRIQLYGLAETVFFGLSLGSVLVLAAIGLAITFGVMGVINMAHGELIMLGAYTTYVIQQLMPDALGFSVLISIPAAFLVAGLVGILIERGVIRFLYGRPLETLLATFGISLILQQAVRSIFSPLNRSVATPEWMSGSLEINSVLSLTLNRLYILLFCFLVFAALYLILKRTSLGLQVRAVSQNRAMARAMGVRSARVDALTFGLGSGIAGVAGVALSQLTNVGPNLGQAYIIDSFMVVVFGGVGNLWGTLVAGLSLGVANKFLEPWAGAVLAKILVLVFIILFIQKRPRGLFPQKGRAAEG